MKQYELFSHVERMEVGILLNKIYRGNMEEAWEKTEEEMIT